MAKIKPTGRLERQRFRNPLRDPQLKLVFDQLAMLIDHRRDDLTWHHEAGVLVDQLRQHAPPGTASPERLAEALGSSTELLRKAGRFAVLYDKRGDVQKLERMKVTWTQLYFSFAVPRRQDRHKLLREAVTNNWTDKDLRLRVQEHIGSKRGGMGGRPTRTPERFGPEMTLWELERLSRKWTVLLEEARSSFRGSEWKKFARSASKDERLGELLLKVESAVKAVAKGCNEIRQVLHTVS